MSAYRTRDGSISVAAILEAQMFGGLRSLVVEPGEVLAWARSNRVELPERGRLAHVNGVRARRGLPPFYLRRPECGDEGLDVPAAPRPTAVPPAPSVPAGFALGEYCPMLIPPEDDQDDDLEARRARRRLQRQMTLDSEPVGRAEGGGAPRSAPFSSPAGASAAADHPPARPSSPTPVPRPPEAVSEVAPSRVEDVRAERAPPCGRPVRARRARVARPAAPVVPVDAPRAAEPVGPEANAVPVVVPSVLDTFVLGVRPVGDLRPKAALTWAWTLRRKSEAAFVRALCKGVPAGRPIRDHVPAHVAEDLGRRHLRAA